MNKFLSIICLPVLALTACGGGQPKPVVVAKPDPVIVAKPDPAAVVTPDPVLVVTTPVVTQPMSPVDNSPNSPAAVCDKDSEEKLTQDAVIDNDDFVKPDIIIHSVLAVFNWSPDEVAQNFKILTKEERNNLSAYDVGSHIALDCTYRNEKASIVKHMLVTTDFVANKNPDGKDEFQFQQEISVDQEIGSSDWSFTGVYYWALSKKLSQTYVLEVTCKKIA